LEEVLGEEKGKEEEVEEQKKTIAFLEERIHYLMKIRKRRI